MVCLLWVDAPCEFLRQVGFMYAPRTQAVRCVLETLTPPKMEDSPRCQSGQTGHNIPGAPIYLDSDFWLPLAIHGRRGQRQAEGVSVKVVVGSRKPFGSATRPRSQHRDSNCRNSWQLQTTRMDTTIMTDSWVFQLLLGRLSAPRFFIRIMQ